MDMEMKSQPRTGSQGEGGELVVEIDDHQLARDAVCETDGGDVPCTTDGESNRLLCDLPGGAPGDMTPIRLRIRTRRRAAGHVSVACCDAEVPNAADQAAIAAARASEETKDNPPVSVPILHRLAGEMFGTFIITFFITGVVASAVTNRGAAQAGLWQVAIVCGLGVVIAIVCVDHVSGAHCNPAVSLAFALLRGFPWEYVLPYMMAQLVGGILAGTATYGMFYPLISDFEDSLSIRRGEDGSEASAMVLCEYFPNPTIPLASSGSVYDITPLSAACIEAFGTAILAFVIFAVTDPFNHFSKEVKFAAPLSIGLTVALLISLIGPLTQAGFNPARDFGPRLVAAMAGWGEVAIPGPRNGFWVYIVGPCVGAPVGGLLYSLTMGRAFRNQ